MRKYIDLTGQQFGRWLVKEKTDKKSSNGCIIWLCECQCKNHTLKEISGSTLRLGRTKSCGCLEQEKKIIDLTGQRFGRLTVLKKDENRITNCGSYWICQCDCGKIKSCRSSSLRRGEIISCGCFRMEHTMQTKEELGLILNLTGQQFGLLTVLSKDPIRTKSGAVKWICKCTCGNIISVSGQNLTRKDENRTISCGCAHKSSGEIYIENLLNINNIKFKSQFIFPDIKKYRYDFAILDKNYNPIRLIEFDGEGHFLEVEHWKSSLKERQQRDKEKNQYALSHNIPLVRIPYWERDNITLEMIMGDQYLVKKE